MVINGTASLKFDSDLLLLPPNHLAHSRRLAAVKYKIEGVGNADRAGYSKAGTRIRKVSDQTSNHRALSVESDPGGFVGSVPRCFSMLFHGFSPLCTGQKAGLV